MGLLIRLAGQWVAGEMRDDALEAARGANARGIDALVNRLGEHHHERAAVETDRQEYLGLVREMGGRGIRGCVSVKPTQFGLLIDRDVALETYVSILDATRARGMRLWLDMEGAATTDATLWVYERLLERHADVGVCLQANLRRTRNDLARLLALGAKIRLTKGAYRETADLAFARRSDIDGAYLAHLETLFREGRDFAVASHDGRMVQRAIELGRDAGVPFEFQMLKGVRDPLKADLVARGFRVLEYIPYGPTWLPYFARRLRERPRNVVTMARSFVSR
jgi:proline dehydrogenase